MINNLITYLASDHHIFFVSFLIKIKQKKIQKFNSKTRIKFTSNLFFLKCFYFYISQRQKFTNSIHRKFKNSQIHKIYFKTVLNVNYLALAG